MPYIASYFAPYILPFLVNESWVCIASNTNHIKGLLYLRQLRGGFNETAADNSTTTSTLETTTTLAPQQTTTESLNASVALSYEESVYYDYSDNATSATSGNATDDEGIDYQQSYVPTDTDTLMELQDLDQPAVISDANAAPTRKKLKRLKQVTSTTTTKARILKRRKKITAVTEP